MSSLLGVEPITFYSGRFKPVLAVLPSGQSVIANDEGDSWANPMLLIQMGPQQLGVLSLLQFTEEERMEPLERPHVLHVTHKIQPNIVKMYEQALGEMRVRKSGLVAARSMPVIDPVVQGGRVT